MSPSKGILLMLMVVVVVDLTLLLPLKSRVVLLVMFFLFRVSQKALIPLVHSYKKAAAAAATAYGKFKDEIITIKGKDIVADKLDEVITIIQNIPGLTAQEQIKGMHVIGRDASKARVVLRVQFANLVASLIPTSVCNIHLIGLCFGYCVNSIMWSASLIATSYQYYVVCKFSYVRYILVIVDDYSRYTWVHFLRSKDEAPEVIIKFLKRITILLQSPVIIIRTDNGTEFKNQVLKVYFDSVGISHQMSSVRTPQQNGVVERRNRTLVEAARTMLIFSRAPLFLWAEAIATACFTKNRSIIHQRFNKTPYELNNGRKPDISFLHVFGALCYPKNDREDIGKLGAKGDIGFFIGYSADSCAYRVYNRRTKKIIETMNVSLDELSAMAFEQRSSKPGLQSMTSGQISSGLDLNCAPSTITMQQPTEENWISLSFMYSGLCVIPRMIVKILGSLVQKVILAFSLVTLLIHVLYRVYNRRTKKIMETMNVSFDDLSAMAFEQRSLKPRLQSMTSGQISSGLDLTYAPSTIKSQQPTKGELDLLFEAMYDDFIGGQPSAAPRTVPAAQAQQ
nr:retrovirus-related Pol polyprotein from transposon TNT 1-94 [Tanacetum cinerariifolium]